MFDVQFIYDVVESNYSNFECYSVYDFINNGLVYDLKEHKTMAMIDRRNKIIYFMGMKTEGHWILEKNYYYKIIQEFVNNLDRYGCEGYLIYEHCSGGEIYYKYK